MKIKIHNSSKFENSDVSQVTPQKVEDFKTYEDNTISRLLILTSASDIKSDILLGK